MREKLKWLPQQYMLDTLDENPRLALYHEGDLSSAVLFGHYLFIGGRYDPEAARFLAEHMLAHYITFAYCPDDEWREGLRALFPEARAQGRALYAVKPYRSPLADARLIRVEKQDLGKYEGADVFVDEVMGTATYDSMDDFFARGIGFSPLIGGRLSGFCTSEYPSKGKCAIGIMVEDPHRGQGIAKAMTRAFLSAACDLEIETVYWECEAENAPSFKTALACGFQKIASYEALVIRR
jgi:RimJ/RimL family protein N-acetyltransferase